MNESGIGCSFASRFFSPAESGVMRDPYDSSKLVSLGTHRTALANMIAGLANIAGHPPPILAA